MKKCNKCGVDKPREEFYRQARNADGLFNYCRPCHNLAVSKYKAINPLKHKAAVLRWQKANREKCNAAVRRWTTANPQKQKEAMLRWRRANRAVIAAHAAKRRALNKRQACDCCAPISFKFIYLQARSLKMHVDHVQPLAKGGKHCLRNLQLLEPVENLRKGARFE